MTDINMVLNTLGLTPNETKVYLALLRHGKMTKTPLVKAARISGSKVYDLLERLKTKGLVSETIIDGIRNFAAVSPLKIKEYIDRKRALLDDAQKSVEELLPRLLTLQPTDQPVISTYQGWEGLDAAYREMLAVLPSEVSVYIIGASSGKQREATERFFTRFGRIAFEKELRIKVLFNETARQYVKSIEKTLARQYDKRFLFNHTPTEICVAHENTIITILRDDPICIRIVSKETAESFKQYFEVLWKAGRK